MKEGFSMSEKQIASGRVIKAFGNLLQVEFEGDIRQGEVAMVRIGSGVSLKAEVIEIVGNVAKIQVFEDTRGVRLGSAPRELPNRTVGSFRTARQRLRRSGRVRRALRSARQPRVSESHRSQCRRR